MRHVKRNLLHFACRHHVLELVGAQHSPLLRPVFRPRDPAVQAVCEVVAAREPASSKPLDDPVDGPDKIIATCHALLKEKQPRDDYREMVQLTIMGLGGVLALTKHEKGELTRVSHDVYRHNVRGTGWMSPHCSTSAPATALALLKALAAYRDKEIGRASGKVMARHMFTSPRSSSASPSSTRRGFGRESGHRSAMQHGWGRRTRLAAPTSPSTQWSSAPWRRLRRPTLSASSPALGPVTISSTSIRPSGRGGTTTPRLVGAPVTYGGGTTLAERGVALISAFCGAITRDEEQRQHLLQVVERHRAFVPVREIDAGFLHRDGFASPHQTPQLYGLVWLI
ncbi:hypothetical protein GWK47_013355 [Chionoecetes opilio]|uniref:Uncharacterized protein n=1 Tax=Chionoecetes opilio TaxID=41210 RepID=A0A8J5C1C8_CHIOP|nr:hypothetical protein GWK47_013355 [Chionoecetes opilio]